MSLDSSTVSEAFRAQIGERERVVAAVFTTYRFEPEFFEQEIVPLMLDQGLAFSADQRIKSIQVREALSDAGLPIEVFYDMDLFRQEGTVSPSMEYLHHGIRGDRSTFHAKLVLLLLEDMERGGQTLCVGAGSANLTIAGWWENIECQHWERVISGKVSRRFLSQLRADVAWLAAHRKGVHDNPGQAIPRIHAFLASCRGSNSALPVSYYGLTSLALGQRRRPAFMRFLRDTMSEQVSADGWWTMEIISPYFAESPDFDGHLHFIRDLGVRELRIFLPVNDDGEALCSPDYYDTMAATDGVQWATWSPELTKQLGVKTSLNRRTHAKVYHLCNGEHSWVFVGSVNFTHRATTDNQEAGFLLHIPSRLTLLEPLQSEPTRWCPEDQLPGAGEGQKECRVLPDLILSYDWKQQVFTAALNDRQQGHALVCDILSPEGAVQVANITISHEATRVDCDHKIIEGLLKSTGFIRVSGRWQPDNETFPAFEVMVQQVNWTHKPLDLPRLSPQEIMQIYAGMSQMRRNQVIEFLKQRQLREMGLVTESAGTHAHEDQGRQFFAEYAELFHAFRNLRKRMDQAWVQERPVQVDYYLSGRGMDSLPTLLESLYEDERDLDVVTVYLALLSLIQIYDRPEYRARPQAEFWLEQCWAKLHTIEASGQIQLVADDGARTRRFFDWYREHFFREYRSITNGDGNAAD